MPISLRLAGTLFVIGSGVSHCYDRDAFFVPMTLRRPTIGVFDSGFGGLTVLKALLEAIPEADYIYFGDTARLPYGSKSVETVTRYACEAAKFLEHQGAEMLVIASNTATPLPIDQITAVPSAP